MDLQSVSWIWTRLICLWWFDFRFDAIFTSVPAASKTMLDSKSGQN